MSFLLTHPSRGATIIKLLPRLICIISTHTPLTGCNVSAIIKEGSIGISTHTPLTGCNIENIEIGNLDTNFYSHTPHGVQPVPTALNSPLKRFLLTHPSRGATAGFRANFKIAKFLLTHPSRGATKQAD